MSGKQKGTCPNPFDGWVPLEKITINDNQEWLIFKRSTLNGFINFKVAFNGWIEGRANFRVAIDLNTNQVTAPDMDYLLKHHPQVYERMNQLIDPFVVKE